MFTCYFCGNEFPDDFTVYKSSECPSCGKDVKVCVNCDFYSPGSRWDCRESISDAVRDKERANFCDFFRPGNRASEGKGSRKADEARSAFNNLFGDE